MRDHTKLRAFILADEIAFGSLRELQYQFGLSTRLGYLNNADISECNSKLSETGKVLAALLRSLRKTQLPNSLTA